MISRIQNQPRPFVCKLYFWLAVLGTMIPGYQFIIFFKDEGFAFNHFFHEAFANLVASALASDLVISSFVFWLFASRLLIRKNQSLTKFLPFIVLNLFIGLSCALPAFLWWRTFFSEQEALSID